MVEVEVEVVKVTPLTTFTDPRLCLKMCARSADPHTAAEKQIPWKTFDALLIDVVDVWSRFGRSVVAVWSLD